MKSFASDNYASVAPEIMQALIEANNNHAPAYGRDEYTKKSLEIVVKLFQRNCKAIFVFTGSAANTVAIKLAVQSHHSILTTDIAHIVVHEVGAVILATGAKLVTINNSNGKLTAEKLKLQIYKEKYWGIHNNKAKLVSITQPTEFGTLYSLEEIRALSDICKGEGLLLHMDGARISNAAVAFDISLDELTQFVDILSLGGTKNGLMFGEAVIIFNENLFETADYLQKQLLQLYSKMRYLSAQFIPYFEKKLWYHHALHANQMCQRLARELSEIPQIQCKYPVETNQIFAHFPQKIITSLQQVYPFYIFDEQTHLIRLITSWDTTAVEVDNFIELIRNQLD